MNKILNYLIGAKKVNDKLGVLKHLAVKYPWAGYLDVGLGIMELFPEMYIHNVIKNMTTAKNDEKIIKFTGNYGDVEPVGFEYNIFKLFFKDKKYKIDVIKSDSDKIEIGQISSKDFHVDFIRTLNLNGSSTTVKMYDEASYKKEIQYLLKKNYGNSIYLEATPKEIKANKDKIFDNPLGDKISQEIAKMIKNNIGASYLLYGPPGTGKTNIANLIGQKSDIGIIKIKNLNQIITLGLGLDMGPFESYRCVLLDDLDHFNVDNYGVLFEFINDLRNDNKIIIATANELDDFPAALIRPGRFDKMIRIDHLDENVVRTMVDGDEELFELVKLQPAACIAEFMKRVRVFGKEAALAEKDEIFERAKLMLGKE